jgi:MFS transporter, DHA1 family, multidrug resistance protein
MFPVRSSAAHPHWLRTVQIVSLTQVAILIGFNFVFPFIPLFIEELGVTDRAELALWSGMTIGAGGITMALLSPLWGVLADRLGRKAMLVRSVAAGSIVIALAAAVTNVWQLLAVRMVQGAFTGTQTAGAMLIAGIAPKERTGFALGLLNTAVQVGNLIGPVLGGFVVLAIGLRSSFLIGAAVLAVCTVITIALVDDASVAAPAPAWSGLRAGARDMLAPFAWPGLRGVLVVGALIQIVYSGTAALIALYVQDLPRPDWLSAEIAIGLSLALGALAAAVAMPILGTYADRHDARTVLVASLGLLALALIPQAIVQNAVVFLALRLAVGVALAGTTSAIGVLTRAGAPAGYEGRAFGTLAAAQNLGWGVGPIVGSAVAAVVGIPGLYLAGGLAMLTLVAPSALSRTWFVPVEEPAETAALAGASQPSR